MFFLSVVGVGRCGVFGYEGLSYDFFMVFVAWELDLKAIKKLVFNSIKYATLEENQKALSLKQLEKKWNLFVVSSNRLLDNKNLN